MSIQFDLVYISDVSPSSLEILHLLKPDSVVFEEESSDTEKMDQRMKNINKLHHKQNQNGNYLYIMFRARWVKSESRIMLKQVL